MSETTNDSLRLSPIWKDVKSTILSGPKLINFNTEVRIHTEKNDFNIIKLLEIQEHCDYAVDTAGSMFVRFYIGVGDYTYKLYPFRNMLEVSIRKILQTETSGADTTGGSPTVRYRATLDLDKNPRPTGTRAPTLEYSTLQTSKDIMEITLELVDRNIEVLRVATVPGKSYREVTPEQLIGGLMVGQSQKYLVDGEPTITAFDIVTPDNTTPMQDILIPSGLKVSNIPTYLQEKLTGVYSTGVGTFYQRYRGHPAWFVYPLYKSSRFNDDVDRVVIFSIPQDQMSGLDRTYRRAGKVLYIVATGGQVYSDDSQNSDLSAGVGFRQADAGGIISKPVQLTEDGPVADRARLNREIGGRQRRDGVYYAPTVAPSSNPFKNYSRVAAQQTSSLVVNWENSEPDLIHPGMPVKYVFMDGGDYRELLGTILGKYSVHSLMGSAATSSTYRTSTQLGMSMEYYEGSPEQPVSDSPGRY